MDNASAAALDGLEKAGNDLWDAQKDETLKLLRLIIDDKLGGKKN